MESAIQPKTKVAVLAVSGGMDSVTLLGEFLQQGYSVFCVSFYYGSKHNPHELHAAGNCVKYFREKYPEQILKHELVDLRMLFKIESLSQSSALLRGSSQEIPEGHYAEDSMKATVVPGRNLIFASILASIAEANKADVIALGVHAGDHHIYPDCRPDFIVNLTMCIQASTEGRVRVAAPFLHENKASILKRGHHQNVIPPYHLTRTCYKDTILSCGKCGSCVERLEAFKTIGIEDPISYMTEYE